MFIKYSNFQVSSLQIEKLMSAIFKGSDQKLSSLMMQTNFLLYLSVYPQRCPAFVWLRLRPFNRSWFPFPGNSFCEFYRPYCFEMRSLADLFVPRSLQILSLIPLIFGQYCVLRRRR